MNGVESDSEKRIGGNLLIEKALDRIQFNDAVPVLEYRGAVFLIDYKGREFGNLYYTKFGLDMKDSIHSVEMPFSKMHTLGELLDRGEGLRKKIPPKTDTLPALAFSIIQVSSKTVIIKKDS